MRPGKGYVIVYKVKSGSIFKGFYIIEKYQFVQSADCIGVLHLHRNDENS